MSRRERERTESALMAIRKSWFGRCAGCRSTTIQIRHDHRRAWQCLGCGSRFDRPTDPK